MSLPKTNTGYVRWRMANGSLCRVCPARDTRRVGCAGSPSAPLVGIAEAPGKDEVNWGIDWQPYGEPLVGASGWTLKARLLEPAGVCDIVENEIGRKRTTRLDIFLHNVSMCRFPKNKVNSPIARKMVACCRNSLVRWLKAALTEYGEQGILALGGTALKILVGEDANIEDWRGRPTEIDIGGLEEWPEDRILKIALRGVKPPEWWPPNEYVLKRILAWQRAGLRAKARPPTLKRLKEMRALLAPEAQQFLGVLDAVVARQRRAMKRASIQTQKSSAGLSTQEPS